MAYQASKNVSVGAVRGGVEAGVGEAAEHVGQHQFLAQAEQENEHAVGDGFGARTGEIGRRELRDDFGRTNDRSGDEVRERR